MTNIEQRVAVAKFAEDRKSLGDERQETQRFLQLYRQWRL